MHIFRKELISTSTRGRRIPRIESQSIDFCAVETDLIKSGKWAQMFRHRCRCYRVQWRQQRWIVRWCSMRTMVVHNNNVDTCQRAGHAAPNTLYTWWWNMKCDVHNQTKSKAHKQFHTIAVIHTCALHIWYGIMYAVFTTYMVCTSRLVYVFEAKNADSRCFSFRNQITWPKLLSSQNGKFCASSALSAHPKTAHQTEWKQRGV